MARGWEGEEGQGEAEEVCTRILLCSSSMADWSMTDCELEMLSWSSMPNPPPDDAYLGGDQEYYNTKRRAPMSDDENVKDYEGGFLGGGEAATGRDEDTDSM